MKMTKNGVLSHEYMTALKAERTPQFIESYTAYGQKYRLAEK